MGQRFVLTQTDTAQMLADCINADAIVTGHSLAVAGMQLPAIADAPDWYGAFTTQWIAIAAHAQEWVSGLAPNIQAIPAAMAGFADLFTAKTAQAQQSLAALRQNPQDATLRQALASDLSDLQAMAGPAADAANGYLPLIGDFAARLAADGAPLAGAVTAATNSLAADASALDALNADIDALNARIDLDRKLLTAATAETVVGVIIVVIGVGLCRAAPVNVDLGRGFLLVGGVLALQGILAGVLLDADIEKAQKKLAEDQANLSNIQTQVLALQAFLGQAQTLAKAVADSSNGLGRLAACWKVFDADLAAVRTALLDGERASSLGDIDALQTDLAAAAGQWNALQPFAAKLAAMPIQSYAAPQIIGQAPNLPQ
jgi:Bacillus haemolytic enterotoxin (HBL)